MTGEDLRVLIVTSEWPTPEHPEWVPFLVQQVEFLRQCGIDVQVFTFRGNKDPRSYIRARRDLHSLLRSKHFDLIHAHWGQGGWVAIGHRVPVVVTFHGSDLQGIIGSSGRYTLGGAVLKRISRYVARRADQVIVVSEHLLQHLPSIQSRVHVIPGGVNLDLFHPMPMAFARQQLGLGPDQRYVLFAADPRNPVKRYELAKAAVDELKGRFPVELLVLAGAHHDRVPLYMNAGDVLALTSKHEGSPTVVKEALACGLPVVSVPVGDVRQRLAVLPECVLCSDDSVAAIAEGIGRVLDWRQRVSHCDVSRLDERVAVRRIVDVYRLALHIN